MQCGQLLVQCRNIVSFGAGFHTLCDGESFVVCGCALVVAVKCSECVSQDYLPLHKIGINGSSLLGSVKSRVELFVGECFGSTREVPKRRGQRGIEGAPVHKDAIIDRVDRSHVHEGLKRTQDDGAELIPCQRTGAHQDRAGDPGRNIDLLSGPHAVRRRQLTTRNSVGVIVDGGLHKVAKPAVMDVVLVEILLHRNELLSPIRVGVGEVSVRIRRAAE